MKAFLFTIVILASLGFPARLPADILEIETNNWQLKRDLTWTCRFIKFDRQSGVADFAYVNGSREVTFSVHFTRIYSLTIDNSDRVNRPFPPTREDLKTPLPTRQSRPRSIELTDKHFVEDDIPNDVRRRTGNGKVFLSGTLLSATAESLTLKARAANRNDMEFELDRSHLLKWIR